MTPEVEPRCEICGRLEGDSPNVMPYEGDWNGETGNHALCEEAHEGHGGAATFRQVEVKMRLTPLDLARSFAQSGDPTERAIGVAMVARSLADDDPDTLRAGWPLDVALKRAAVYLGLEPTPALIADAGALAPELSDALLNRRPAVRDRGVGRP